MELPCAVIRVHASMWCHTASDFAKLFLLYQRLKKIVRQTLRISHTCTQGNTSTSTLSLLNTTPTLIAASCRGRSLKALVLRIFPFLRHLLLPTRVMELSTVESIFVDNARHLQPAGYKTHKTVCGGARKELRINISPIHSDPLSGRPLSCVPCAQSYLVVASRASGDAARPGASLLLISAVIGQDVSPQTAGGLIPLDK